MKFSLDPAAGNMIVAYDVGVIRVRNTLATTETRETAEQAVTSSTIITPATILRDWAPQSLDEVTPAHLRQVLEFQPEIILLGTGRQLRFPAMEIMEVCHQAGTGIEVMDTGAACRTYNILAAEGRHVAAALLMIQA
ncbi:MAG: hypothetical protein GC149_00655 [Gammaproteobacteria bacterium]|nr:hypothetical protein [Gammaproteobacteria bacterium]